MQDTYIGIDKILYCNGRAVRLKARVQLLGWLQEQEDAVF
jgi:hypothetical protein